MSDKGNQSVVDLTPLPGERGSFREGSNARLRRKLAGDLDVITLKALRKEPQRRYPSVEQMAEDIRRHLEGLPVQAVTDSIRYRTRKFLQRHTIGVTATLVILIAVSGGIATTIREARIADANERRAEERFNDVRKLAGSLMFEIHDSIAGLPGATPARKLIVQRSLEYLDSLSREAAGDVSLQRELASAYMKLGQVQGTATGSNLGDFNGALQSFRKALAIRQGIVTAGSIRMEDRIALSEAERLTGFVLWMDLDATSEGLLHIRRSVEIAEYAARDLPHDDSVLIELADGYRQLADILAGNGIRAGTGDLADAREIHRKTLEIRKRLADDRPSDQLRQQRLGGAYFAVADDLVKEGKRVEGLTFYLKARDLFATLAQDENDKIFRTSLAVCYSRIGDLLLFDGKPLEAVAAFQQDETLVEPLAAADPTDVHHQMKLAGAIASEGNALVQAGKAAQGRRLLVRALAIVNGLPAAEHDSQIRGYRAFITGWIGEGSQSMGDLGEALREYREASELYASLAGRDSRNSEDHASESEMRGHMGSTYLQAGDATKALNEYQQAYSIVNSLLSHQGNNIVLLYAAAYASAGLGKTYATLEQRSNDPAEQARHCASAADWYQTSLASWKRIPNPSRFAPNSFTELVDANHVASEARIVADHCSAAKRKKDSGALSIAARQGV